MASSGRESKKSKRHDSGSSSENSSVRQKRRNGNNGNTWLERLFHVVANPQRARSKRGSKDGKKSSKKRGSKAGSAATSNSTGGNDLAQSLQTKAIHVSESGEIECSVCMIEQPADRYPRLSSCGHWTCEDCLYQYLLFDILEGRVSAACPCCPASLHPTEVYSLLRSRPDVLRKYEEFSLKKALARDPDTRWCPAPDCGYAVIAAGCASCPQIRCRRPGCNTQFCYHCRALWHPDQTCDSARATRRANSPNSSTVGLFSRSNGNVKHGVKACPRCSIYIVKTDDGSCNHMTCASCGADFCWLCMKEISDIHYLSPSGCTFWGKKPWSRKKKLLWQLGTLVGAPVGIALVAGLALPVLVVALPVWVGRRVYSHRRYGHKHKRNAAVAGSVVGAVIAAPVAAALAVGVGVPVMLAYVYGVVPISLCRNGGCVDSGEAESVKIDLGEESVPPSHLPDTYSMAAGNPSIAPSIGEVSMAFENRLSASGSHIERVGRDHDDTDRESASQQAAGGSLVESASTHANRLEVHADVSQPPRRRHSMSSDSANFSATVSVNFSETKSATVSFSDDVSTRVLAGSLCSQSMKSRGELADSVPPVPERSVREGHTSRSEGHTSRSEGHTSRSEGHAGAGDVLSTDKLSIKSSDAPCGILRATDTERVESTCSARDTSPASTSRVTFDVNLHRHKRRGKRETEAREDSLDEAEVE